MLVPEQLRGQRVVADTDAIDALAAVLPATSTILRIAPDEALVLGPTGLQLDDPHAIIEDEAGFVAFTVDRDVIKRHTEWSLPAEVGKLAQGSISGVPAKLTWLPDGRARVVTHAAYAADLVDRLR